MGRSKKTTRVEIVAVETPIVEIEPKILPDLTQEETREEQLAVAEIDQQIALSNSKVPTKYKVLYKMRARAAGIKGKAAKRSTWDWLAQQMKELVLTEKDKLKVQAFEELMAANGIDTNKWPSRTPGWEGRLRMTGGIALRRKLADSGILHLADGTTRQMPDEDLQKLVHKFSL
jgi:hypothetical protein